MKRIITALGIGLTTALLTGTALAASVTIGLAIDGSADREAPLIEALMAEITALNSPQHTIVAPPETRLFGDDDPAKIAANIDRLMADPAVRLVIAIGPIASHTLARRPQHEKPAFAPFVLDPTVQGLPRAEGRSGVKNLNYLMVPYDIGRAVSHVKSLFGARKVALLTEGSMFAVAPGVPTSVATLGREAGVELVLAPTRGDAIAAVDALPADVDAVIVTPQPQLSEAQFVAFAEALRARKMPSFSFLSEINVRLGLLAGEVPRRYGERLRRRLALNVQRTLDGEDPATFPVTFDGGANRLWVNMETARAVGVELSWAVLIDAKVISPDPPATRQLGLEGAMNEARQRNLDLKAKLLERDAGLEEIRQARANLLPSLDIGAQARLIDSDRAANSFGTNPEFLAAGAITAQQVIYAEGAWAGLHIQQALQGDKEASLRALELDTVQAAAVGWFNVLRARSLIETNVRNLEAARENLELALVRRSVGATTEADVWRWESEIARIKQDLISAFATEGQARLQVNRLLDRPDTEQFGVEPEQATDDALLARFSALMSFLDGQAKFDVFSAFMADEAVQNAPEIAQLDAAIAATERDLTRITRGHFVPDVILQGELSTTFTTAGEGTEPLEIAIPGMMADETEEADDINWQLTLVASMPLFEGGARTAEAAEARLTLRRLQVQRESLARKLRQSVQNELLTAMASFAAIELSQARRDAAKKSLDLTAKAYTVGSVSIADFVDAQTNAFAAEQGAVNAVYDFMIAMTNVERAMGISRIMVNAADRQAFAARLIEAWRQHGTEVPTPPADALPDGSNSTVEPSVPSNPPSPDPAKASPTPAAAP